MKIETIQFEHKLHRIEVDPDDSTVGRLDGEGSTFGNLDLGNDVVQRGAFKKTIKEHNGNFPILLDHDARHPAGIAEAKETKTGLFLMMKLRLVSPEVRQRFELAKDFLEAKMSMGLSIGFSSIKFDMDHNTGIRLLKELKLHEISLVIFPMNTMAAVTAAKALDAITNGNDDPNEIVGLFYKHMQKLGYDDLTIKDALQLQLKQIASKADPHGILGSLDECLARF